MDSDVADNISVLSIDSNLRAPSVALTDSFIQHIEQPDKYRVVRDQLAYLIKLNDKELKTASPQRGDSLTNGTVQMITWMCQQLRVSDNERYYAIEIYDKWMLSFSAQIKMVTTGCSVEKRQEVEAVVKKNSILYMAVCIQYASKVVGMMTNVCPKNVRTLLHSMRSAVRVEEILAAEIVILKTFDKGLGILTPMEVIEPFLLLLKLDQVEYRRLYDQCVKLTDLVYLLKDDIYGALKERVYASKMMHMSPDVYSRCVNNYVLRAAGIILCAMCILFPASTVPRYVPVIEVLMNSTSLCSSKHFSLLAECIAECLFKP